MASGLGSTGKGAEAGPTKDVVRELIQILVDPRLPSSISIDDLLYDDSQKSVARQMRAVVLLYNYFYRKQNPDLEFLDFASFCKLAVMLRPSLTPFMKTVNGNGTGDHLSVTEKAIKDACDIAMSLDASKDDPIIEGLPISKVAVLLIDSKRENCLLHFGAVTEGVWSLIEREILGEEILREESVCKKRKTNKKNDDSKLLQLGYDAVKGVIGVDSSDLMVLETHVVYSLSKEKSAAQFYMMQCPHTFDIKKSVPLEFLAKSLHGPLAEKFFDGWSVATPIVEHFHMLPYVGFISDWLQRKDSCLPTLNGYNGRTIMNYDGKELPRSKIPSFPLPQYSGEDLDHIDTCSSDTKISSSNKVANENNEAYQEKTKHSSGAKMVNSLDVFVRHRTVIDELKNRSNILNSAKKDGSEKVDNDGRKHETGSLSGPSRGLSQSVVRDDNATQRIITSDLAKSSFKSEETKKLNSEIGAHHQRRMDVSSAHGPEDGVNLKVEKADLMKSKGSLCRDKNITAENDDVAKSCNQTDTATEKAPRQHEALRNNEAGNAMASEDLHNAVALLHWKRQELHSQICTMEDELALYEHKIERIRDGGEVELARKCIKSILSGRAEVQDKGRQPDEDHNNPQSETKTKFSCTFLPGKSSCQDLEYICLKNNWRLPRYYVRSSDDKFLSTVVVQINEDFNLPSKGSKEASPSEARESAAAQVIAKIRDTCA